MVLTLNHLCLILEYDALIQGGTTFEHPYPIGYEGFAEAFNDFNLLRGMEDEKRLVVFGPTCQNPSITGAPLSLTDFVGTITPTPIIHTPQPPAGGLYLDAHYVGVLGELFWENAENQ